MAHAENRRLRRHIGIRIRELRVRAGISSQELLADLAGVHRTFVGRLERGESGVTVETLAALLLPMGMGLAEFFAPFRTSLRLKTPRRRG